jgi:hypothetical protein
MSRAILLAGCCWLFLAPPSTPAEEDLFPFILSYDNPDNVTNISSWLARPAGKHGFVRGSEGHLATDQGRIRFWATNFCFDACFPTHEQAERVAERMARFGINCVRMHHMDARSIWGNRPDKRQIDPRQLERLDYLIYQLKQHGVYTNLNLHVSRWFGPSEGFPERGEQPKYDKGLDNFEPRMIELQKQYARDLLTHVNPYTKTAYVQEPAIAFIEINNENALFTEWSRRHLDSLVEPHAVTFQAEWNAWLRAKYETTERLRQAWDGGSKPLGDELLRNGDFTAALAGTWTMERDDKTRVEVDVLENGPAGSRVFRIDVRQQGEESWRPQLSQSGFAVKADQPYTVTCWLRGEAAGSVGLNCKMAHDPWQHLGFSTEVSIGSEWKAYRFTFVASQDDDRARLTVTNLKPGVYELAAFSLRPGGIIGLPEGVRLEDGTVPVLKRGEKNFTQAAQSDFVDFLWDTEWKYWQTMYRFIKEDLGAIPLVSGTQLSYSPVYCQTALDYIDAHSYWQHPRFPGRAWDSRNWYVDNVALVNSPGGTLASLSARRVAGMPFTVSEYNHPTPNQYAAEGFPMLSAMAAFQDWDGLYAFAYCHNDDFEPDRLSSYFDIKADPTRLAHLPACAAMFVRGDVDSAEQQTTAKITPESERRQLHETGDPWTLTTGTFGVDPQLSLRHAIALELTDKEPAASAEPVASVAVNGPVSEDGLVYDSDTGQLRWDASIDGAGYFTVDAARTRLFTGFVRNRKFRIGDIDLEIGQTRLDWATVSMVCIDGEGFDRPGRILITATGEMQNTDAQLEVLQANRVTLQKGWGRAPILCEGIPATIRLPVSPDRVRFFPLDERGNRREAAEVETREGQAAIRLDSRHQTIWYEVVIH